MQNKVYSDCGYLELSFSSLSLIDRIGCGFFLLISYLSIKDGIHSQYKLYERSYDPFVASDNI